MSTDAVKEAIEKIAEGFGDLANAVESAFEEKDVISPSKLKAKGKGKKKAEEDEELELEDDEDADEDDESEEDDEDADEDDESEEDDEDADEDETVTDLELKTLKDALKKYSAKHTKPKAVKILQKFAKASQDVKRKDFAKLLKLLKV